MSRGGVKEPGMRGEIERDLERLARVLKQIRALEVQQEQQVYSRVQPTVTRLARLVGNRMQFNYR
ncbi:hypothetical protein WM11_11230 [Burkholderia ubonensis]|nr:hypothetical protein WM11_11230 [Burkholderia ubonensis]